MKIKFTNKDIIEKRENLFSAFASSHRNAFTLAEVLITLGIIGVVAAMTIPILMNNIQNAQYKTAYKKAYSTLSQAFTQATADNALEEPTGGYAPEHWKNFATIMSYMKLQNTCLNYNGSGAVTDNSQCWKSGKEGWNMGAGGFPATNDMSAVDSSGMAWGLCARAFAPLYAVDTNGFKEPNQMGKDRFIFILKTASTGDFWHRTGMPIRVSPTDDNDGTNCGLNKCGTVGDKDYHTYYGTSWLSNQN